MQFLLNLRRLSYATTPDYLQFIFRPGQMFIRNLRNLRIKLWTLTGLELNSKQELTILFASNDAHIDYFKELAFGGDCKVTYLGKVWLFQVPKLAKQKKDIYSIMVAEVPKFVLFNVKDCFHIPSWVQGEVDISGDISEIIKKHHQLQIDERKIRKYALSFERTNEASRLHDFYYNMYLPYITKRHGNSALIENYHLLKKTFYNCDLIMIKFEGREIAGGLIDHKGHKANLWCLGIKDANPEYVKMGAMGAFYYYSFQYLKDKGFKKAGVGGSRPFLNDGVLNYKRKWGLKITEQFEGLFLLKPLKMTGGAKTFLVNNPFMYSDKGKFNSAVFLNEAISIDEAIKEDISKKYGCLGLSKIDIFCLNNEEKTPSWQISKEIPIRPIIPNGCST